MSSFAKFINLFQNAIFFKQYFFLAPKSHFIYKILELFLLKGYIYGFSDSPIYKKKFKIYLKYVENKPIIKQLKIMSSISKKRFYVHNHFFKKQQTLNFFLITTSQGLFFSNQESFIKKAIGGELLLQLRII